MLRKEKIILFIFLFTISCNVFHKKYEVGVGGLYRDYELQPNVYRYNLDFPKEDKYNNLYVIDKFKEGRKRIGRIIKGKRTGKWLSGNADFDEQGNVYAKGKIWKEEHFKNDLRNGVFRQYDNNGNIIYETTFKDGTGLWKEFHSNGQLYFEMYTKNGYFTDTLRLYDDKGNLIGKRLYIKDSLVYSSGKPCFPCLEGRHDF